jgi:predicted DNA-binding transcriptional regulator AlpA
MHDADFFGERYLGRKYLRVTEVISLGLAGNRRTVHNLVKRGELPAPIRLGRLLLFSTAEMAERPTALAAARNIGTESED